MLKKYIVLIAFALSLSALATAEPQPGSESRTCVLMLPAGTTVGALFDPRIYMCTAQVRGAPTDEIGFQKSKANAQAAGAQFTASGRCRQIGLDQRAKMFSFCPTESECTAYTTYLHISCGQGEIRPIPPSQEAFQRCVQACHESTDGGIETAICVRDCNHLRTFPH